MEKNPFNDQYQALKAKQAELAVLMAEQEIVMALIQRRRFRLTLLYVVLIGVLIGVAVWVL